VELHKDLSVILRKNTCWLVGNNFEVSGFWDYSIYGYIFRKMVKYVHLEVVWLLSLKWLGGKSRQLTSIGRGVSSDWKQLVADTEK